MPTCKHAFIVPQKFLLRQAKMYGNYHLLIGHEFLVMDPALRVASYNFWRTVQQFGHFIMLDNGAYELGSAMNDTNFAEICCSIVPHEIILPDVLYNMEASMQRAQEFSELFDFLFDPHKFCAATDVQHAVRKAAVLQVETRNGTEINFSDIIEQLKFYHNKLNVTTICIPRHFGHDRPFGRLEFTERLHEFLTRNSYWLDVFQFHYLGAACLPEFQYLPRYYWIRGLDSATPFVYAYYGCTIKENMDTIQGKTCARPKEFFDVDTLKYPTLLRHNVNYVNQLMNIGKHVGRWDKWSNRF